MTQDEIIELAKRAGFVKYELDDGTTEAFDKRYAKFAALVAEQEREACCAIVYGRCDSDNVAHRTVDAIRARGTI